MQGLLYSFISHGRFVQGRERQDSRGHSAGLKRVWVLSSECWTVNEEILEEKWQDRDLFSKDCCSSGVKREGRLSSCSV